jgi:uncharacterized short protein YbdD (DUF466 family)
MSWRFVREISGDDAYERYLAHLSSAHPDARPLARAEFFRARQDQKWNRITRCC